MGHQLNGCVKFSLIALSCWGGTVLAEDNEVTVSTVEGLVAELASCDGSTPKTIVLEAGDYQLTSAQQTTNSSLGVSHLSIPKYVTLKGGGANPEATRLIGDGVSGRIMHVTSNTATIENLTLTNGVTVNAETVTNEKEEYRGAALAGYGVITNCIIIGNNALGIGGAVASSKKADGMLLCDCQILNNSGTSAGGVYNARLRNCTISGNTARTGEGGGGYSCILTGGIVSNNTTLISSKCGGGLFQSSATGTLFTCNITLQKGGAVAESACTNCIFVANKGKYGGAAQKGRLVNCEIYNNYATSQGGATFESNIENSEIWNNCAVGDGGGIYGGVVRHSVISNNFGATGPNAYAADMFDCDIVGMAAANGSATRCVFRDIGEERSLIGNPYAETSQKSTYAYYWYPNATNCLFVNNHLTTASSSLFCGVQVAEKSSSVVNCTIVSNSYCYLVRYCRTADYPMLVQNTVIYDNFVYESTTPRDINIATSADSSNRCVPGALIFDHCVYKTKQSSLDLTDYIIDNSLYRFGQDGFGADPKFAMSRDENHPFSPKRTSPLRGRGRPLDWMIGAYDLRGDADGGKYLRLQDGDVDIGCYQCWLDPIGTSIVIR